MADTDSKNVQEGAIIGFTKPRKFLFFKIKSKPIYQGHAPLGQKPGIGRQSTAPTGFQGAAAQQGKAREGGRVKFSRLDIYLDNVVAKHRYLDVQLKEEGMKGSPQEFAKRMMRNTIIISAAIAISVFALIYKALSVSTSQPLVVALLLGVVAGAASYNFLFRQFLTYPAVRAKQRGREVERGILFAARDIIISLRSGVPLFNALTSVSTGYGPASSEFAKIINLIQLGAPMDQAIDQVSASSTSRTFKRIMLQASVSIREGADVVSALQEVVDQAMQERVIELRRYGQRLNALSMFYMLFGIILPSMGIAVLSILTTFINIFTVTDTLLILVLVFIAIIQFVFFNIMKNSRPLFTL